MKRILLCCGTGVATSTVVNKKLAEELKKRGHGGDFTITQCKAAEVPGQLLSLRFLGGRGFLTLPPLVCQLRIFSLQRLKPEF